MMVGSGIIDDIVKDNDFDIDHVINNQANWVIQGNFQDNADQISMCTQPYMLDLVAAGTGLDQVVTSPLDLANVLKDTVAGQKRSKSNWFFSIDAPLIAASNLVLKWWGKLAESAVGQLVQTNATLGSQVTRNILYAIVNMVTAGGAKKYGKILDYVNNVQYPVGIPTPSEAGAAWLANTIDDCTFQTYVMAGDNKFAPYKQVVMAGKLKFSALELMTLYKRQGMLRGSIQGRLRELGSLEQEDEQELENLFQQIPGPADIIRFMVRDTENPDVVNTFQTDANFDDNYQGILQQWAQYQGVSDDVMRREWRAHWSIPSPTQLYEVLHRLRHDPDYSASHDVEGDVQQALIQQDILPYWIPALLAISYHPLTRTDLNRAYDRGWISDDDYLTGMYNNGYSDDDAATLLRFAQNERLIAVKNSDFGRMWIDGQISTEQRNDLADQEGFSTEVIEQMDDMLTTYRQIEMQKATINAMIGQYKRCIITEDELTKDAASLSIPDEVVQWQLSWAGFASTCGTRREMVGSLGSALSEGLITADDYVQRMTKLRFDTPSINTYLALVQNRIAANAAKKAAAAQKAAAKAEKEAEAAEEKAERQAAAQANRLAKQLAQAERGRQARNKVLETATAGVEQYVSDAGDTPAAIVTGLYNVLQTQLGLSQNEAAHVISAVTSRKQTMTTAQFSAEVMATGQASLANPWLLFPAFQSVI